MTLTTEHTKSKLIVDSIESGILSGALKPGDRLQSVRSIAASFSSSISVVQNALRSLERKNLVESKPGSGVFVRTQSHALGSATHIILCAPEGHVYSELNSSIRQLLFRKGSVPVTVDYSQMIALKPDPAFRKQVNDILASGAEAVILHGDSYWRHQFLDDFPTLRAVFLSIVDYPGPMPERAVLLDYETSFHLATSHLLRLGRKRVALCAFKPDPRSLSPETFSRHHSSQMVNGYEQALRECGGVSYVNHIPRTELEINEQFLKRLMASKERPDAIVCDLDHTVLQLTMAAMRLGVKIPDDVALTGFFDTPWCEQAPVKITSITFEWQKLAEHAVKLALEDKPSQKLIYMKPKLVIRETCGGEK